MVKELRKRSTTFIMEGFKYKIVIMPNADRTDWEHWEFYNVTHNKLVKKGNLEHE